MPFITATDGTQLYDKDWGPRDGQPVVFSHGWPLNADSWEGQMLFLPEHGCRTIAHDRRGHGRSSQPWTGHDMDTYADDLATLIETLEKNPCGRPFAVFDGLRAGTRQPRAVVQRHRLRALLRLEPSWCGGLAGPRDLLAFLKS